MFDGLLAGCSLDVTQTHMPFLGAMTMPPHSAWTGTWQACWIQIGNASTNLVPRDIGYHTRVRECITLMG